MMPAGRYYIGDLCYVMHDEWDEFCSITIQDRECLNGEFALTDGRRFATYGTAYGDGVYPCSNGSSLGVDAGLIGCICVDDISENDRNSIYLGTVVDFAKPFDTSESNGVIRFGHITVDTGDSVTYDNEEYDYED